MHTDDDFEYVNAASSGDCTGLIPAGNPNEDERDAFNEIEHFEPPVYKKKEEEKKKRTE